MSQPDPIKLKCLACPKEQEFTDPGAIIGSGWDVVCNKDDKMYPLCPRCSRALPARDERDSQLKGNSPKQVVYETETIAPGPVTHQETKVTSQGLKARARFSLVSVDVEVGGKTIAGLPDLQVLDLLTSLDKLEVGKEYSVALK